MSQIYQDKVTKFQNTLCSWFKPSHDAVSAVRDPRLFAAVPCWLDLFVTRGRRPTMEGSWMTSNNNNNNNCQTYTRLIPTAEILFHETYRRINVEIMIYAINTYMQLTSIMRLKTLQLRRTMMIRREGLIKQ